MCSAALCGELELGEHHGEHGLKILPAMILPLYDLPSLFTSYLKFTDFVSEPTVTALWV